MSTHLSADTMLATERQIAKAIDALAYDARAARTPDEARDLAAAALDLAHARARLLYPED